MRKFTWSMFSKTLNLKVVNLLAPNHSQKPLVHSSGTFMKKILTNSNMDKKWQSSISQGFWNDLWSFKSFELIFNFKEGHFKSKSKSNK